MATIILKATEECNSNCEYCDVVKKERPVRTMSLDTLRQVFARIDEYLGPRPFERITIIWHGGEPLLLGVEYFEAAYALQSECCPGTKDRIEHAIQSNLTLFQEGFIPIFQKLKIDQIGSSFDPIAGTRGAVRKGGRVDSRGYNEAFLRADALACRHGFSAGVICVVTRRSLSRPLDIFHHLANLKLGSGFDFHPVLIDGAPNGEIGITAEEYVEFLGAIFPVWWQNRERYPHVDPFKSLDRNITGNGRSLTCVDSGGCEGSHLNIGPDGRASHCGRSADWGILDYGDIMTRSLQEILADEKRSAFTERTELLEKGSCGRCRFWSICHGGCPLDSWFSHRDYRHKTNWCHAKKGFIEKYYEPVTGIRFEPDARAH